MNEIFSWRRLALLLRNDIMGGYRTLLIHSAALAVLIVAGSMMNVYFNGASLNPIYWFPALLFIWGPVIASRAFGELHDKTRNESFLLLPGSSLEKTAARLLLVTAGFLGFVLAYTTVVSFLAETANLLVFGRQNELFRPFDPLVGVLVGHYVVAQSLYFLGAAWFRKAHFWKTALATTAIWCGCIAFAVLLGWLLFEPYRDGFGVSFNEGELYSIFLGRTPLIDRVGQAAKIAYYFVLPPFCWLVAWLRVKETQVSYGV
ncbi:MAG TPA: hypothetical protein VJA26_09325 [Gammaproteobacteria bacterium]|nr:hypothetical protein [Gammaproteobacteria bacterium]